MKELTWVFDPAPCYITYNFPDFFHPYRLYVFDKVFLVKFSTDLTRLSNMKTWRMLICSRPVFMFFQLMLEATIYGKRSGSIRGLVLMHKDKANIFRATRGWKVGVVHDVGMLPRSAMYKPDAPRLNLQSLIFCYQNGDGKNVDLQINIFDSWAC